MGSVRILWQTLRKILSALAEFSERRASGASYGIGAVVLDSSKLQVKMELCIMSPEMGLHVAKRVGYVLIIVLNFGKGHVAINVTWCMRNMARNRYHCGADEGIGIPSHASRTIRTA